MSCRITKVDVNGLGVSDVKDSIGLQTNTEKEKAIITRPETIIKQYVIIKVKKKKNQTSGGKRVLT